MYEYRVSDLCVDFSPVDAQEPDILSIESVTCDKCVDFSNGHSCKPYIFSIESVACDTVLGSLSVELVTCDILISVLGCLNLELVTCDILISVLVIY